MNVLAHGLADATLPIPAEALQLLGLVAVGAVYRWGPSAPATHDSAADAPPKSSRRSSVLARSIAALAVAVAIVNGFFGPTDISQNPGTRFLWILLPSLLLVATVAAGERIRLWNPLRWFAPATGDDSTLSLMRLAPRTGYRLGLGALATLVWLRLVLVNDPFTAALAAAAYVVGSLAAALAFGRRWFEHGDPVELGVAALSSGRANPASATSLRANGHDSLPVRSFLAVLVGGAVFETWLERTTLGAIVTDSNPVILAVGVMVTIALVEVTSRAAASTAELVPALVPLAIGYVGVHALGPLVLDSQIVLLQTLDAITSAAGRPGVVVAESREVVGPEILGMVSVLVVTAGHLWAVVESQRLPVSLSAARARSARLQFAAVVGASLYLAIALLF